MQADVSLATRDYRTLTAGFLAIGSVLFIASAIVQVFGFHGVATGDRVYAIAELSSVIPALLAVGAVAMLGRRSSARWPVTIARIAAVIIIAASVYGIGYALFAHVSLTSSGDSTFIAVFKENWSYRVGAAIRFAGAGLVAIGALALSLRSWSAERPAVG